MNRPHSTILRRLFGPLLAGLILTVFAGPVAPVAAAPMLRLEPAQGPCVDHNPPLTARGSGFVPGMAIMMHVRRASDPVNIPRPLVGKTQVAADGTFTATIQLFGCAPVIPSGTQFIINAQEDGVFMNDLALATFTVGPVGSGSPSPMPGLPNTGAGGATGRFATALLPFCAVLLTIAFGQRLRRLRR